MTLHHPRGEIVSISLSTLSLSTLSLPHSLYFESDGILTKVNPRQSFSSSEAETEKTEEEEDDGGEDIGAYQSQVDLSEVEMETRSQGRMKKAAISEAEDSIPEDQFTLYRYGIKIKLKRSGGFKEVWNHKPSNYSSPVYNESKLGSLRLNQPTLVVLIPLQVGLDA
ncbi:hypothetical protein F2Q70_00010920 [Brassica cretica]|uniref:Uncharacterized protein n=1 Tax=Brassica cretica TaxID=69181 RepID=A0A8S9LZD6_BRACR|nr:hypothetical protein F2Q70_00010920 [Brassica cretica]